MHFVLTTEQQMLVQSARDYCTQYGASKIIREQMSGVGDYLRNNWDKVCQELGWQGILVPESCSGLELGIVELVLILEQIGSCLLPVPVMSTLGQYGMAIARLGDAQQQHAWLPDVAAGTTCGTLAWHPATKSEPNRWDTAVINATYCSTKTGFCLNGEYQYVLDGGQADNVVALARDVDSGELSAFVISLPCIGVDCVVQPMLDPTLNIYRMTLSEVMVPASDRLTLSNEESIEALLLLSALYQTADQLGGIGKLLDTSVAYAQQREQFGRPISTFQAIQHKAADMLVQHETAITAVYAAACRADEYLAGALSLPSLKQAVSIAQATASEAYQHVASEAIQLHGAVGVTWEFDLHWYFKRARISALLYGDSAYHYDYLAQTALTASYDIEGDIS